MVACFQAARESHSKHQDSNISTTLRVVGCLKKSRKKKTVDSEEIQINNWEVKHPQNSVNHLVGGFTPFEKHVTYSNWIISQKNRGENERESSLKPPPSNGIFYTISTG